MTLATGETRANAKASGKQYQEEDFRLYIHFQIKAMKLNVTVYRQG